MATPRLAARPLGRRPTGTRGPAPWTFLALTLVSTWTLLGVAAGTGGRWLEFPTIVIGGLGLLAPSVVATVLVRQGRSYETVRGFWRRVLVPHGVRWPWYPAMVAVAVLPYLAARLIQGGISAGLVETAPPVGFIAISLLAGIVEEPGWRGYALDGLQRRHPVVVASLVVGVVWSVWHLPLFVIDGTFQSELGGLGSRGFWLFSGTIVVQSVVYAWIYTATGRSIFAVVVFHALQDVAGEVFSVHGAEGVELLIWTAVAAVVALGPLRRAARRTDSVREALRHG
jgi:membrane protease YdiL (CAAX protease family)